MITISAVDHLPSQAALIVNLKEIQRYMLWPQLRRSFQTAPKRLIRLVGQTGYQIQADVLKTGLARLAYEVNGVVNRVQSADCAEFLVIKRLRPDAESIYAEITKGLKQTSAY
jgi:hypothetical protein